MTLATSPIATLLRALLLLLPLVWFGCATDDPLPPEVELECSCANGAACAEDGSCICAAGFYDATCDQSCGCDNGAVCNDGAQGNGSCTCPSGFFGATCAGVCNCSAEQACVDGASGDGACLCPNGEQGATCETEPTCTCANGGACDGAGQCICQPGFYGTTCDQACACPTGSSCDDGRDGTGACGECPAGTYGAACDQQCDCDNGALCDDGKSGSGSCTCPDGFYGARCESACDCGGQPCNETTGACGECPAGTYGAACDQQCDCVNGALCDDGKSGSGACSCPTGFYGMRCDQRCDCGGGTCDDGAGGSGACTCPSGSFGADCGGACSCGNGASCDDGAGGDGACTCVAGTFGSDCAGVCPGSSGAMVCSGHGTCDDGAGGSGGCTCLGGWTGSDCSTPPVCNNPGSSIGDMMILEVMYDAPNGGGHTEPSSEYLILYNNSCGPIDLTGWELCDNSGCKTLSSRTIAAGAALAIIHTSSATGLGRYGCTANAATIDRAAAFDDGQWFSNNLANSGDRLEIKNTTGVVVDALSYGTDTTIFSPAIADASDGDAIQRLGYPWSGTLPANTDANAWVTGPVGGHLCNLGPSGSF